jgi:type IV pilus assembly protein PilY1
LALRDKNGDLVRSLKGNTLVPAQGDQPTVFVNQKGQIAVGLTVINPEKGAINVGQTAAVDPVRDVGFLEVSESAHACRHATAQPDNAVCQ